MIQRWALVQFNSSIPGQFSILAAPPALLEACPAMTGSGLCGAEELLQLDGFHIYLTTCIDFNFPCRSVYAHEPESTCSGSCSHVNETLHLSQHLDPGSLPSNSSDGIPSTARNACAFWLWLPSQNLKRGVVASKCQQRGMSEYTIMWGQPETDHGACEQPSHLEIRRHCRGFFLCVHKSADQGGRCDRDTTTRCCDSWDET